LDATPQGIFDSNLGRFTAKIAAGLEVGSVHTNTISMSILKDDLKLTHLPKVNRALGARVEARLEWVSTAPDEAKARADFFQRVYGDIAWLFRKYAEKVEKEVPAAQSPGWEALRKEIDDRLRGRRQLAINGAMAEGSARAEA
jgi:hypothetical protein